jgi:L,D-transpeptidase ErfK/SrfK
MRRPRCGLALALAGGLIVLAGGCRQARLKLLLPKIVGPPAITDKTAFERKPLATHALKLAADDKAPADTVIGARRTHRVREGETLLDIARWYDLGYNEIVGANPGMDPWVPPVGKTVMLPTEWVLPCCRYEGLVLNIPEMRLYHYRRAAGRGLVVETYPVGLGRTDRRTPRGRYKVRGKTTNPRWNVPESIRREHIRDRGDARTTIPGGHPDNPLGKYRIELTVPLYSIHGTNIPWGAGMMVSHGCVRLYPEDIEHLFPLVAVGTPVEFVYQPVKVGSRGGETFVEVHDDVYKIDASRLRSAMSELKRRGLADGIERRGLEASLASSCGMPVRVPRERAGGREVKGTAASPAS